MIKYIKEIDDLKVVCNFCGRYNKNGKPISTFQDRESLSLFDLHKKCVSKFKKELKNACK